MPSIKVSAYAPTPHMQTISPQNVTNLGAGAAQSLLRVNGKGIANVVLRGDGSGPLQVRIVVDGTTTETYALTDVAIHTSAFSRSIEIQAYNPGTAAASGTTPTIDVVIYGTIS